MNEITLKQKILNSPDDIKQIINSFDIADFIDMLTTKYKLSEDQSGKVWDEIIYVLVGLSKKSDLTNRVAAIGIQQNIVGNIVKAIDEIIFSKVRISLEKIQSTISNDAKVATALPTTSTPSHEEENINMNDVLAEIENPTPTKPAVQNPIGKNVILDAQHNLPEQEKKVLIGSSAVPSRGPMLGNFKVQPISRPIQPVSQSIQPIIPVTPPLQPTPQPVQAPKAPQAPSAPAPSVPKAPSKYTVDPYREPLE